MKNVFIVCITFMTNDIDKRTTRMRENWKNIYGNFKCLEKLI